MMEKIRVKDVLYLTGGNTKVIIGNCFNPDNKFYELWRGVVEDIDWHCIPYGENYVEAITVVNGEDWLQIWT